MISVLNEGDRKALLARLSHLSPDHTPRWGTLSAGKMLCHLGDQVAVALGDTPATSIGSPLTRQLSKFAVIRMRIPIPKGRIMTAPEMLVTEPSAWHDDIDRLRTLLSRLAQTASVSPHPAFGRLTHHQWGVVTAMHIDHHLRQFGV